MLRMLLVLQFLHCHWCDTSSNVHFMIVFFLPTHWNFTTITVANRKGIKTREESHSWRSVSHPHISTYTLTHRHLQTHKGRHYLEAMDHVNGILSTLRECGRCFSAWLRRLSSGTVCTTNSIYFIFRDEDGRLERLNISVCLYVCVWAVGYAAVWEIK